MEITKGENANLAGMEPRCPKCGNGLCVIVDTDPNDYQCFAVAISCQDGSCQYKVFPGWDAKDFLPFFRSPAPTPPLDVEAVARELEEEELKRIRAGKLRLTEKEKVELLRRHIASPAPQPLEVDEVDDRLEVLYEAEEMEPVRKWRINFKLPDGARIALVNFYSAAQAMAQIRGMLLHAKRESPAASPAQPEKRDEWVSVDERTPELSGEYIVCFASGTISGNCHWNVSTKAWGNNRDGSSWNITHWQPLPAPPQSGKEGQ